MIVVLTGHLTTEGGRDTVEAELVLLGRHACVVEAMPIVSAIGRRRLVATMLRTEADRIFAVPDRLQGSVEVDRYPTAIHHQDFLPRSQVEMRQSIARNWD